MLVIKLIFKLSEAVYIKRSYALTPISEWKVYTEWVKDTNKNKHSAELNRITLAVTNKSHYDPLVYPMVPLIP